MARTLLAASAVALVAAQPFYWWRYPNTDAENLDIRRLPCDDSCTLAELEAACGADPTCVAFNSHGYLKNSTADMGPDSCDLYLKKTTPPPSPPPVYFFPIPVSLTFGSGANVSVLVNPALTFNIQPAGNSDLIAYAGRIADLVFQQSPGGATPGGAVTSVSITVADPSAPLALDMDESYTLSIPADGSPIVITANTTYGAYMALQTLSQAIRFDFDAQQYSVVGVPINIRDAPKFTWRGILVDTDRHWLSLKALYAIIDSLTYAKMTVMHWHIVDWQSWPLQSTAYPALWSYAWSPRERYTFGDVAAVVEYARQRGVRVVPEFDTPGHATSMCHGYPDLCPLNCGAGGNNPLTPVPDANGNNVTLTAIQAVLAEIAAITPDEFFHLGGDEVDETCWQNDPAVQAWMQKQGYGNNTDMVYEYFVSAVDSMAISLNKSPIRWEEVWKHFGTDLDKRTVIHAWLSSDALINATNLGYRAIWSVDGLYYLDNLQETWTGFYDVDILAGVTNMSAIPLILGGETEMWGETADGSDVLQTIYPRAAAAAERLWSYDVTTNSSDPYVLPRLQAFRCLLLERGIPAAPVMNAVAREGPGGPGSCTSQ